MIPIVPAVIPQSFEALRDAAKQLSFSPELHVDVVDGTFVDSRSWPYVPEGVPLSIKPYTDTYTLEVDLMVMDPISAATAWIKAGADILVFHTESCQPADLEAFSRDHAVSVCIALQNNTPLDVLQSYLPYIDGVQLMGIPVIGKQGQPFDDRVLERIRGVRTLAPSLPITIDGSVNEATIQAVVEAGAHRLICGSAIIGSEDPYAAYVRLRALVSG